MKSTSPEKIVYSSFVTKFPVFYGWVIMVVGTLGTIMTSPGQTYAVSIFIEHFISDLNTSRSMVSTLYSVATLAASFLLPFVGRLFDKRGGRLVVAVVAALFGMACIFMGFVQNVVMLGIGFFFIRLLGQGSLTMTCSTIINQWWVYRRGMVMGISGMVGALLGVGLFPNLIHWSISTSSWQTTYMFFGLALLLILAPMTWTLLRDRPEKYGLNPDGVSDSSKDLAQSKTPAREQNWTLPEAIRTPVFWILTLGQGVIWMLYTGQFFHMVSIIEDNGLPVDIGATVFVPIAVVTAITIFGSGFIVDRVPVKVLVSLSLFLQALSLPLAMALTGIEVAYLYGVVLGVISGLSRLIVGVVWAMYFGRKHLGVIAGFTAALLAGASALGPMPLGIARDVFGSYQMALYLLAILPLSLGVVSLFIKKPQKKRTSEV